MAKVKSVFVDGLPESWTQETVREHFTPYGEILSVVLSKNLPNAKRKGFGFINFAAREVSFILPPTRVCSFRASLWKIERWRVGKKIEKWRVGSVFNKRHQIFFNPNHHWEAVNMRAELRASLDPTLRRAALQCRQIRPKFLASFPFPTPIMRACHQRTHWTWFC
jgi:hypothetical protein